MLLFFSFFLIHRGFGFELLFIQLVWSWRAKVSDVVIALALPVKHQTPFELGLSSIYPLLMFFPRWYSSLPMMMLIPPWCFSADDVDDRLRWLIAAAWPDRSSMARKLAPATISPPSAPPPTWGVGVPPPPIWGHLLHVGTSTNMGAHPPPWGYLLPTRGHFHQHGSTYYHRGIFISKSLKY